MGGSAAARNRPGSGHGGLLAHDGGGAPAGAVTGRSTGGRPRHSGGETTTERTARRQPERGLSLGGRRRSATSTSTCADKLDAGERRRRLAEERTGAEALLSGALNELAAIGAARRGPARRADRPAGGDRAGARAARGRGRRPGGGRDAPAERGDAPRRPGGGRRGGVDRGRQRQPRGRRDPAGRRGGSPTPPGRVWRGSRTSGRV